MTAYPEGMLAFYQGSAARIRQILEFAPALQMTAEDEQPLRTKLAEYEHKIAAYQRWAQMMAGIPLYEGGHFELETLPAFPKRDGNG